MAGFFAGSYWATFTLGRIVAGLYAKRAGVNLLVMGGLAGAWVGAVLLWWNPAAWINLLAVALMGFAVAPIFPALTSGTSARVGAHFAANTIGMQMAAAGLGVAAGPGIIGVIARQTSLEMVPVCLFVLFTTLLGLYTLATRLKSNQISL
jgi:MFS family permease